MLSSFRARVPLEAHCAISRSMTKSRVIALDFLALLALIAWSKWGPWIGLLGFSTYHSRGNVILPTPPAAIAFFRNMVTVGATAFAIVFAACSILANRASREADSGIGRVLYGSFDGNSGKLAVKYSAFLIVAIVAPFFFHWMRYRPLAHWQRIAGGAVMMIAAFAVLLALGRIVFSRAERERQVPPTV